MRDVFISELLVEANARGNIILITGDLGFGVMDEFMKSLPDQFINAGVAEQNMTGMAAGLAVEGYNVFTYSIGNFSTLRCLEQIRNDVLYHDLSVNIVAVGGGFSYGALGMSHHATEDVAILRSLPGLRVFAPCDETETLGLVKQMIEEPGASYLRLDKSKFTGSGSEGFARGKLRQIVAGEDVTLIAYGGVVEEVVKATDLLKRSGINCSVYSAHTIKPFDQKTLFKIAKNSDILIAVEEHVKSGGLGSLIADTLFGSGFSPRKFDRICLPDSFSSIVGSQDYLRKCHFLDADSIKNRVQYLHGVR